MIYPEVCEALFLERPNRFIAHVELAGEKTTVHVKNTGRCRELLKPGTRPTRPLRSGWPDRVSTWSTGNMPTGTPASTSTWKRERSAGCWR